MMHPRPTRWWALPLAPADARLEIAPGLVAWRWGEGPRVLLVHGFEGGRQQFSALVAALTASGFQAIALDMPAHGDSTGRETNVAEFATATATAIRALGPLHAIVAHSMGAATAYAAIAAEGGVGRLVAFAAPSGFRRVLKGYARGFGLSRRGAAAFIASVEARVGRPADDFELRNVARDLALPVLLIHDSNDPVVPVVESARAARLLPQATLRVTRELGHNRPLADPENVAAVMAFLGRPD